MTRLLGRLQIEAARVGMGRGVPNSPPGFWAFPGSGPVVTVYDEVNAQGNVR